MGALANGLRGHGLLRVATHSDNSPTQAAINKLFTTAFPLSFFLEKVASWAHARGLALELGHVPGIKNTDADDLSRNRLNKFLNSSLAQRFPVHLAHLQKATREVSLADAHVHWSQGLLDIAQAPASSQTTRVPFWASQVGVNARLPVRSYASRISLPAAYLPKAAPVEKRHCQ